jgi:protein-S-isoprenylcysteine O-methyltransferase Ste14
MKSLETKVPPPALLLITMLLMWTGARWWGGPVLVGEAFACSGFLLIGIGVVIFFFSVFKFGKAKTTINPMVPSSASLLVTGGIFSLSRNPMYVGMVMVLVGWAIYLRLVLPWVGIPFFVVYMTRFQIIAEERALTEKFGEVYLAYKKKVRRWI